MNTTTFRTVQHDGRTLAVLTVDFSTDDTIVIAAPVVGFKHRLGRVTQIRTNSAYRVRLVNPEITETPKMVSAVRPMLAPRAPAPSLGPVPVELAKLAERIVPKSFAVRCVRVAAELGMEYSTATRAECIEIEALAATSFVD